LASATRLQGNIFISFIITGAEINKVQIFIAGITGSSIKLFSVHSNSIGQKLNYDKKDISQILLSLSAQKKANKKERLGFLILCYNYNGRWKEHSANITGIIAISKKVLIFMSIRLASIKYGKKCIHHQFHFT
jgi:hypothetical protein